MPTTRCLWCTDPPLEEVAVLKWRGTPSAADASDRERLTVQLCRKHLERLRKAGEKVAKPKAGSTKKAGGRPRIRCHRLSAHPPLAPSAGDSTNRPTPPRMIADD